MQVVSRNRAEEVEAMRAQLQPLQEMIDSALGRLGLRG